MKTINVKATEITPLHCVEHQDLVDEIQASMARNGWEGRPLLACDYDGEICALTGSHRIAAARGADVEIPVMVVVLSKEQMERVWEGFQEDRLAILLETGNADAIALMQREIEEGR